MRMKGTNARAWFYSQSFHQNMEPAPKPEATCGCGFRGTKLGYDMHDCVRMTALTESRAEHEESCRGRCGDCAERLAEAAEVEQERKEDR